MALITGLAGVLGRVAGRLLNSSLGWATVLLFGKVSGRKQWLLLGMAIGALVWVVLVIGVIVPEVGTFLIALVPLPSFVSRDLVRWVMLAGAILLPLLVGVAAVVVAEGAKRARGRGLIGGVLRGYPFTLLLAFTIAFLAVVATVRKVTALAHRWEDAHVPLIVKPGHYDQVLDQLADVLRSTGLEVAKEPAPRVLSAPPKLLAAVAGQGIGGLVPDRLMLLKAQDLEILVYPSDVAVAGSKAKVARSRAVIASELTRAPAYLTTTAESEQLEDELRQVADAADRESPAAARDRLRTIDNKLLDLTIPFDEWQVVYRERLQVERDLMAGDAPGSGPLDDRARGGAAGEGGRDRVATGRDGSRGYNGPDRRSDDRPDRRAGRRSTGRGVAAGAMALLAIDVALQLTERVLGREEGARR